MIKNCLIRLVAWRVTRKPNPMGYPLPARVDQSEPEPTRGLAQSGPDPTQRQVGSGEPGGSGSGLTSLIKDYRYFNKII